MAKEVLAGLFLKTQGIVFSKYGQIKIVIL